MKPLAAVDAHVGARDMVSQLRPRTQALLLAAMLLLGAAAGAIAAAELSRPAAAPAPAGMTCGFDPRNACVEGQIAPDPDGSGDVRLQGLDYVASFRQRQLNISSGQGLLTDQDAFHKSTASHPAPGTYVLELRGLYLPAGLELRAGAVRVWPEPVGWDGWGLQQRTSGTRLTIRIVEGEQNKPRDIPSSSRLHFVTYVVAGDDPLAHITDS